MSRLNCYLKETICGIILLTGFMMAGAQSGDQNKQSGNEKDTNIQADTIKPVVTSGVVISPLSDKFKSVGYEIPANYIGKQPYISLQQLMKGNVAGVYIQEPSGEPGTEQNIFIRGISSPLLSKRELFDNQATVFLNGIPLTQDNPFVYEIQKYDFNRIGTATNILSSINLNNVKSIEVIKDPAMLSQLGPLASNGAIWITTKNAVSGFREISVNTYAGSVLKPRITPVNAAFENAFRIPFYDKYGTINDRLNYPTYLRDSTNADYYGPANWYESYYRNEPLYSVDLSLTGGSERANFRFFTGATRNSGNADATRLDRYTGSFFINVAPLKWLTVSSMISYDRLDRKRNKNIRDRLAEQRYLPDLTNPLTPNKILYDSYLREFSKTLDKNITNLLRGYVALSANLARISYNGRIGFDYNQSTRDVFWPTTLLEKNNFVSNYFGYNQRFIVSNSLSYVFEFEKSKLSVTGGQNFMADVNKYDYSFAYNGPNDFIKINVVNGDPNAIDYLKSSFRAYYFPSRMQSRLAGFYGNLGYSYDNFLRIIGTIRRDGSSNMQPDNRWFTSYSVGVEADIYQKLNSKPDQLNALAVTASYGKLGKLLNDDRFNSGPAYRVDLGFTGEPTLGSYIGVPGISRPYTTGWVGYGIPWAFSQQQNIGVRLGLFDRVQLILDVYNKDDKDMLLPVPVPVEWGYEAAYESGLAVNNKGVELSVQTEILKELSVKWTFTGNVAFNKNKLTALPAGLNEVIIGDQKLMVGKSIDGFWLLSNNGVYNSNSDVPVGANGKPLSFQGVPLQAGDPKWVDLNGDNIINDQDRLLQGNILPKTVGGFGSSISYKNFSLDFQFYFALGRKILNQYASRRLDFVNTESNNDINSVKEITFWEKKMDLSKYPMYNQWSDVVPYRIDQDLFLENGSFLKLRTLSLGYDLAPLVKNNTTIKKAVIYLTGSNLLTLTGFKGDDPELVQYNGIYTGYGLPIPSSLIFGIKIDL